MNEAFGRIIAGDSPVFLLIAGPNGASKSTFTTKRLTPIGFPSVDPDKVALEIFGRHPTTAEEALRATVESTQRVRQRFSERRSIALESVFSDTKGRKLALLSEAKAKGFRTVLVFIGVDTPEICIARVMDRVEHGGHDVPDELIRARFPRCFENLKAALGVVDLAILIDNSGCYSPADTDPAAGRHYVFGVVERGQHAQISDPTPRWFTQFDIARAIENLQGTD
jgi:predicted ABC-type ATPase